MVSVSRRGSRKHLSILRDILPEEMVEKYLRECPDPDFRVIIT